MHVQDMWTTTPIGKKFFPPVHFQRVVTESLYDMLTNFHRWCVSKKMVYWLTAGTLLGAVRHYDLIPWDDDVDVMIEHEAFQSLLEIAKLPPAERHSSLPAGYDIHIVTHKSGLVYAKIYLIDGDRPHEYPWAYPFLDVFELLDQGEDGFIMKGLTSKKDRIWKNRDDLYPPLPYFVGGEWLMGPRNPMPALSVYGSDVFVHCEAATWDHRLEQWRFKQGKSVFCAELDHYYGIAQKLGAPTRDVDLKRSVTKDGCDRAVVNGNGASVTWCNSGFPPDKQFFNPGLDDKQFRE